MATSKEQNITITASTGLSERDIQDMVKDAEVHSEEDRKRKQEIEAKNQLENLIYNTEKTKNENKDKLSSDDAGLLDTALTSAKDAVSAGDAERIKNAIDELTKASHKLAETLYKRTAESTSGGAQQGAPQGGAGGGKGDDDVVDAEFEDVKK